MRFILATSIVAMATLGAASPLPATEETGMAIPITKHSSLLNPDKCVDSDVFNSHLALVRAKILHGFENYERNTGTRHPSTVQSLGKRRNSVSLIKASCWYGPIWVGTPPRLLYVEFDTGACDFFLPASTCVTCVGHNLWDLTKSSSVEDLHAIVRLSYTTGGTVDGYLCRDTVSIAGFTADSQTITAAVIYPFGFQRPQFVPDGLMGLGFQSVSAYGASSVIETLVSQGRLVYPVFSFKLSYPGAELYIGGVNPDLYTGSFTFVPVTVIGYWQVTMDRIHYKGFTILSNMAAVIDTGSAFITGPPGAVAVLYQVLHGTFVSNDDYVLGGPFASNDGIERYTFPCNGFPTVSLTFGGRSFQIPPSSLNIGPVSIDSSDCVSGIVGLDTASSLWIVGHVFLENVYTMFDLNVKRVGFARLAFI